MRKGLVVIFGMGLGAMAMLALLANHYLQVNPAIRALQDLRVVARDAYHDRLVSLYWAPTPPAGQPGHGLRAIFRPEYGPKAPTRAQQANRLGDWLLAQWNAPGLPPLAYVEVKGITDGDAAWVRVIRARPAPPAGGIAPSSGTRYPPPAPAPAPTPTSTAAPDERH